MRVIETDEDSVYAEYSEQIGLAGPDNDGEPLVVTAILVVGTKICSGIAELIKSVDFLTETIRDK